MTQRGHIGRPLRRGKNTFAGSQFSLRGVNFRFRNGQRQPAAGIDGVQRQPVAETARYAQTGGVRMRLFPNSQVLARMLERL